MSVKATRKFIVVEFHRGDVWLELCNGRKSGLQFAVPCDSSCQEELEKLDVGEKITATLVSKNDKNTEWGFVDITRGNGYRKH
jgi:hypothetical protein